MDTKSCETISVDPGDYKHCLERWPQSYKMNKLNKQWLSVKTPWKYFVDRPFHPGEVFVKVWGKCFAVSCGYVSSPFFIGQ
jgi:hypothetical protein